MKRQSRAFGIKAVAYGAAFAAMVMILLACMETSGIAAAIPTHKEQSGALPKTGAVALRSGLEWMDETSALFMELKAALDPLLTARGLSVQDVAPSTLAALPPGIAAGQSPAPAQDPKLKAAASKAEGNIKPITLKSYNGAGSAQAGKSSRSSGKEYTPQTMHFARTQQEGMPVMVRGGRIPGHLPVQVISDDPENLDFVIVCRFAAVSPHYIGEADLLRRENAETRVQADTVGTGAIFFFNGNPDDFVTAAGPVKGVGTLGYGAPAPAAPPRSSYGSTPGDYNRGYEGNSPIPGDPWHREADLKARDYQLRHGEAPQMATPPASGGVSAPPAAVPAPAPSLPKPPLPGDTDMPAISPGPAPSRPPQSPPGPQSVKGKPAVKLPIAGYALEMDCYDLRPARSGKQPKVVWRCTVQQRADKPSLSAALPDMIRVALGAKSK